MAMDEDVKRQDSLSELLTSDFIKCSHCNQLFTKPRLLPCLHTFCETCIQNLIKNGLQENNSKEEFLCPTCEMVVLIPASGITDFTRNVFNENLVRLYQCKNNHNRNCDYCMYDGKTVEGTSLCLQCNDDMCRDCADAHKKTKAVRNHNVVSYSDIHKGLHDQDIRGKQEVYCPKHNLPNEKFCQNCEELLCEECEHQNHQIFTIDKVFMNYKKQAENLLNCIERRIPVIENQLDVFEDYNVSMEKTRNNITSVINDEAEKLHKNVDEHKQQLLNDLNKTSDDERKKIEEKTSKLKASTLTLKDNLEYLNKILSHAKPIELLAMNTEIKSNLEHVINTNIDTMEKQLKVSFTQGHNSTTIPSLIGKLNFSQERVHHKTSSVKYEKYSSVNNYRSSIPSINYETPSHQMKIFDDNNVKLITSFDARGHSDMKDIWPSGVAATVSGDIIIIDRENKRVKVFSEDGMLLNEFGGTVGEKALLAPFDVALMKDGNLAITDYQSESIKIFTINGNYVKEIKGNFGYPRGIAVNSKGEIIVIDCRTLNMSIIGPISGKLLDKINGLDGDSTPFVDPYYVNSSIVGNLIVTDSAAPNIKIFNKNRILVSKYGQYGSQENQFLQPYGVCSDKWGYIFIADNNNNRIHMLTPEGTFHKFLLTKKDGLWRPIALTINNDGHLVVTEALGRVKIYKYI